MKITKIKAMMLAIVVGLFMSLQPAYGWSTSTIKWLGKGKFGVAVGGDLTVNAAVKNAKFAAVAKPFVKGKLFGKQFTLVSLDGKLGNYGSTDWDAKQRDQKFNSYKLNQVKYSAAVRPFGITVAFMKDGIGIGKGSLKKDIVLCPKSGGKPKCWGIYKRKELFVTNIPAGPIVIRVSAGAFGKLEFKPTFSVYGMAAMALTAAPRASIGAFAEGAVNLAILKGGIGAELTLIEGWGGLRLGVEPFPGVAGLYLIAGVDVLKGKVYAFVDRIGIKCCFKKRWVRMLNLTVFGWSGKRFINDQNSKPGWSILPNSRGDYDINFDVEAESEKPIKRLEQDLLKIKPAWKKRYEKALWRKELYSYTQLMTWIKKQK